MMVFIKEWPNKTATIISENGQVIWNHREEEPEKGLFTGSQGEWVIVGPKASPTGEAENKDGEPQSKTDPEKKKNPEKSSDGEQ